MKQAPVKLPDDPVALKEMVRSLVAENNLLEEKLGLLKARLFGRSSEKSRSNDDAQGELFDELEVSAGEDDKNASDGEDGKAEEETITYNRKKPKRKPLPEHLPRKDVIHDIPDEQKQCACGCTKKQIGEVVSEKLCIQPAKVWVERHIRPQYACQDCEGVEDDGPTVAIAPVPAQILPKTMASASLIAWLITSKFCDHLPFYRQAGILQRSGVKISRSTMSEWALKVADQCKPLLDLMRQEILSGPVIGIDETTVQVLGEEGRANTQKSYMWVFRGGSSIRGNGLPDKQAVIFQYHSGRSGQVARDFLGRYKGWVQTDGFSGYDWIDATSGMKHIGCTAHSRRKFHEAASIVGKKRRRRTSADVAMKFFRKLYAIEARARQLQLGPDEIHALRQKEAVPVLAEFKAWLDDICVRVNPKGTLGKAVGYALKQWPRLIRYVEDGRLPIDNNLVENAIRPFCLGRKNWLFSGSPKGAAASAALYSIIETARACGHEPYAYLRHLFEQLPLCQSEDDYRRLLPMNILPDGQPKS